MNLDIIKITHSVLYHVVLIFNNRIIDKILVFR